MTTFEFQGRITENGKLEIELPQGLPAGEVTVRINIPDAEDEDSANEPAWTEQELEQMMKRQPKTNAEIVAMLAKMPPIEFVGSEISDVTEWVKAQRRKGDDRLKPYWEGKK